MHLLDSALHDLRYGLRMLGRNRGFALAAILTLGLGIGATTAVFSVVQSVVLQPLPYPDPGRLINLWTLSAQLQGRALNGAANYRDWRAQQTSFEELALIRHVASFNLTADNEPERLQGARVTASLFRVLGVQPVLGRGFREEEEQVGKENVVLLSNDLWKRRFGADPNIVGKSVQLSGERHTIIGVMPAGFRYPGRGLPGLASGGDFQLWVPLTVDPQEYTTRIGFNFLCVGRLKPGITIETAQAEMNRIAANLSERFPMNQRFSAGVSLSPMLEDTIGSVRKPLYIILGVVVSVLLVGCANLVNLLIVRSIARRRDWTVRAALGASKGRLVLQSLMEVVPVIVIGGFFGLLLAGWMLDLVTPFLPPDMPRTENIGMNGQVLAFAALTMFVTTLLTGLWPAFQAVRTNIAENLRGVARGMSSGRGASRLRDLLVIGQVAAVVVLLIGASLLIRSFIALKTVDPGFRSENTLTMNFAIPRTKYPKDVQVAEFCRTVMDQVRQLQGVRYAAMVNRLPLAFGTQIGTLNIEGRDGEKNLDSVDWRTATPDYFKAMSIPLIAGRFFTEADDTAHPPVGIIDDKIAKSVFGSENPLGKRFQIPFPGQPWVEIVGVVGHVHHEGLGSDPRGQVYWNYHQRPQDRMVLVVRADRDPAFLVSSVLGQIRTIDPEQPVYDVRTLKDVVDRSVSQQWLTATLVGLFAAVSVALAMVGVYGVTAYAVGQRSREIGIRIALGAERREIMRMVLRDGWGLAATGIGIGLALAIVLTRLLASLLYEVKASDLLSFFGSSALIAIVTLLACLIPARRAASVDPISVLRAD